MDVVCVSSLMSFFNKINIHSKILSLLWRHICHMIAYKILYLKVYFVFKRTIRLTIRHIMQGHIQQVPVDLSFHFQNCKHFLEYFGFYLLTAIYTEKAILRIFVYLFISKITTAKVNFYFYKQCSQDAIRLICKQAIFA